MKKSIKIILIVLIVLLCFIILNFIRNIIIINNLINQSIDSTISNNYHVIENKSIPIQNRNIKNDLYVKNNVFLLKQYEDNTLSASYWKDYNINDEKSISSEGDSIEFNETLIESITNSIFFNTNTITLWKKINYSLFHITSITDTSIIVKLGNTKYYYDKSTAVLQKMESPNITSTFSIEFNNVSEKDIAL